MKHFFTLFIILLTSFAGISQRTVNLDVKILAPSSPFSVDTNETFDLDILISNLGPDAVTMDDSLFFYMTISGDTMQFPPQGNYEIFQSAIASGASVTTSKSMTFNSSFEGLNAQLCISYRPRNGASPLSDSDNSNNVSCIQVAVGEQSTAGIGENSSVALSIYPNPAKDIMSIQADAQILSVAIVDPSGKSVALNQLSVNTLDCSGLSAGIYYITVETSNGKAVEKFAVQRN